MGRTGRILVVGLFWGVFEALLFMWIFPQEASWQSIGFMCCPITVEVRTDLGVFLFAYFQALAGFAVWLVIGLGSMMGYIVREYATMTKAFLVGQLIGGAILLAGSGSTPLFLVLPLALLFVIGILSGLSGALLSERMFLLRQFYLDWRPISLGMLSQALIIVLPLSRPVSSGLAVLVNPVGGGYVTLVMSILLIVGMTAAILTVVRGRLLSSNLAGFFLIASFVLGALTVVCIGFATQVGNNSTVREVLAVPTGMLYSTQAQLYQTITWLLVLSLAIPALIFLRFLFPRRIPREKQLTDLSLRRQEGA